MGSLRRLNDALQRGTGYRVSRPPPPEPYVPVRPPSSSDDRLVRQPVFVLSSPRAGSTLLRVLLDGHSAIHAPIELHTRRLAVRLNTPPVEQAMESLDLNVRDLEHLLWDRLLHRQLTRSGKRVIVEKTPSNVFAVNRLRTCWPDARFVFLLRHPMAVAQSWHEGDPEARPMEVAIPHVLQYLDALEQARQALPGLTVRYEDLTVDPARETERVCSFLGLPWEPEMLDYGPRADHAEFVKGIGDWSEAIRSGRIEARRPLPGNAEIPDLLLPLCSTWTYA